MEGADNVEPVHEVPEMEEVDEAEQHDLNAE